MRLRGIVPSVLLIQVAIGNPVWLAPTSNHAIEKRQLDLLGPLLKEIMNPASGGTPAVPVTAVSPTPAPATTLDTDDCTDALQKINDALDTSEKFMKANGNPPTIRDIQAVLSILAESLNDDCDDNQKRHLDARDHESTEAVSSSSKLILAPRGAKCSSCERQLYNIVRQLQKILNMTKQGMAQDIGGVANKTVQV